MSMLSAETGQLNQSGNQLKEKASEYQKLMNDVFAIIEELRNDWKGKDNEAFTSKLQEYKKPLEDLGLVIDNYGEFLIQTGTLYARTQDDITGQVGNI